MSEKTGIQWTDATWNPTRGCSRVSEGCRNCYAERIAVRFSGPGEWGEGFADAPRRHSQTGRATTGTRGKWTGKVALVPEKLEEPLRWKKPRRVFVNSMSDLFHESLRDEAIASVFVVMALARRHTFQILTKRPERLRQFMADVYRPGLLNDVRLTRFGGTGAFAEDITEWPPNNVWLGVSVEDQRTAEARIPLLLESPAAVRFVSYEPALGPVDFERIGVYAGEPLAAVDEIVGRVERPALDWIIVGGESGQGARPFEVKWARAVLKACRPARPTKVFVKQMGSHPLANDYDREVSENGTLWKEREPGLWWMKVSGKGGDPSEWPADLRVREFPA